MKDQVRKAFCIVLTALVVIPFAKSARAQIQVTSATPNNTTQGTVNLDVVVKGNGFKKGAKAQWFVSGTTNPGGVAVNSTAFNNSGQVTANITVAVDASIGGFDIVVTNADGRGGKGTELFAVNKKTQTASCQVPVPMNTPISVSSCSTAGVEGCLDSTFGNGGLVLTNTDGVVPETNDFDQAQAVKELNDGTNRLVAFGTTTNPALQPGNLGVAVVRYTPNGALDTTFGSGGIFTDFSLTNQPVFGKDGTIDGSGNALALIEANGTAVVARITPKGALDKTFNSTGYSPVVNVRPYAILLQPDGKVIAAGYASSHSQTYGALFRLNTNGQLDITFGTKGVITITSLTTVYAISFQTVDSATYVLAGGQTPSGDFGIARVGLATGTIDTSFGVTSGIATATFCGSGSRLGTLSVDSSGRILAGGVAQVTSKGSLEAALARFTGSGLIDTTFGDPSTTGPSYTGQTLLDIYSYNNYLTSLQPYVDSSGNSETIVGGYTMESDGRRYPFVARYTGAGALDATFGTSGVVAIDFGNGNTSLGQLSPSTLLIQADGKPVIAGFSGFASGPYSGYNFALARLWP